jgi:hypothetical protein
MAEGTSGGLIESVVGMATRFGDVATASPEQGLLVLAGALITGLSVAAFGYLAAGAGLDALASVMPSGRAPPPRER